MSGKEVAFPSFNGRDTIKGWIYTPKGEPRAIVQVTHGFAEHSRRYLHLIETLLDAGFIVCADDHVAHGQTALDNNSWGDPGDKGFMTTIEDTHTLLKMTAEEYPDLPWFLFGHSWGSSIARGYAAVYGEHLRGLLLCGVLSQLKGLEVLKGNQELERMIKGGKGKQDGTEFMGIILMDMTSRYDNPATDLDWVVEDSAVLAAYLNDPLVNLTRPYTVQFAYDMSELYQFIENKDWSAHVPEKLAVYLLAGDRDPVCNYGEGLYHVSNLLWESGHRNVTTRCYAGKRHEVHNEPAIRDEVEKGIVDFINSQI